MTKEQDGSNSKPGIAQLIQTAGAGVALVVAVSTALYTGYQKIWVDPKVVADAHKKDFLDAIEKFANTSQTMQTSMSLAMNDQAKATIQGSATATLVGALTQAENAAASKGFTATPYQFDQLAADEEFVGRWDQTAMYARKALDSGAINYDAANAHDMIGKSILATKGKDAIADGRREMEKSLDSLSSSKIFGTNISRINFLSDWVYLEGMFGDCKKYHDLKQRIMNISTNSDVSPGYGKASLSTPNLIQAGSRCAASNEQQDSQLDPAEKPSNAFLPSAIEVKDPDDAIYSPGSRSMIQAKLPNGILHESLNLYVSGKRLAHIHLNKENPTTTVNLIAQLGDSYSLDGLLSVNENGQIREKNVKGAGHFHGKILPIYHLELGRSSPTDQIQFLDRGPSKL